MCWKVDTPSIDTSMQITGADIVPSTTAKEPDAPRYGGNEDTFNKKRGKSMLKIDSNSSSNYTPINI